MGRRRHGADRGEPASARSTAIPKLREEFWQNVSVPGTPDNLNQSLEYAGRVADYLEFAELLALDALSAASRAAATSARRARRPTARRCATTSTSRTWRRGSSRASGKPPELHKEPLEFDEVHPTQRSYK